MGSIISTGIGSGIDIDSLVERLVAAEGQAKSVALTTKEAGLQAKLSAFGSFKSALDGLRRALEPLKDIARFQSRAVSVGDSKLLAVSAASAAVPGSYAIEVEQLASAHKMASAAYTSETTPVGTGTLTVSLGALSVDIVVDSGNNTLVGLRDAINAAPGNPGVSATIINEVNGARLILTSNKTGAVNTIGLSASGGDGGLETLAAGLTEAQAARNSRVIIDSFAYEGDSNTITGAVSGLTFTLLATSEPDVTTQVGVSFDKGAATKAVNDFVTAYNALVTGIKGFTAFDAKTRAAGALLGDSTLRDFQSALARERGRPVTGASSAFTSLAELGITAKLDGTLEVDSTKLEAAIASNFDQVGAFFANAGSETLPMPGLARRLDALVENYTKLDGLIDARTKGLESSIETIAEQREKLNERLAAVEKRLRDQFNAMDAVVARLRSTGNFLLQQLSLFGASQS